MSAGIPRIVAFGEAMLELSREGTSWRLGYGGDTLNMAIHCARLGLSSAYFTALGDNPFSAAMRDQLGREGLDLSLILTDPARPTGLYAIATDEAGERGFTYWRQGSAASALPEQPAFEQMAERCLEADLFFFSLISLAILSESGRARLLDLASQVRAKGGRIAFDGNYRFQLWEDVKTARRWRDASAALADFGLPSLDDERALGGFDNAEEVAGSWRGAGTKEVVVKLGAAGCLLDSGELVAPAQQIEAVDTSGAGDAFDAGYLSARLIGEPQRTAAARANRLAGWVAMRNGAIPPIDPLAPYPAFGRAAAI